MEETAIPTTSTHNGQASAAPNGSFNSQNRLLGPHNVSDLGNGLTGRPEVVAYESDDDESENSSESEWEDDSESDSSTAAESQNRSEQNRVGTVNNIQETAAVREKKHFPPDHLYPSEPQLQDVVPISSKEFENALEDALVCPVCYLPYNSQKRRPRMLACGHTFCSFCIKQIHKTDIFTFSLFHHISITCPVCRAGHTFDCLKDIPLNRVVEDLVCVGNPPEKDGNKEHGDETREGQPSNNTVTMSGKGMLLSSLFVGILAYCLYLWNANSSLQSNLDVVNDKFATDLDSIHTKLKNCMGMANAEIQLGCLKGAFGKTSVDIDEKINIKEKKKIIYMENNRKSQLMDIFMKKDHFRRRSFSREEIHFIPREEDFFNKLSKSFQADNTNDVNFFELMLSLDFTSPGQTGAWLWLERVLTWIMQYFCMAHCIRYLCLYWWLRLGSLLLTGFLVWKTGEGIQAAFPVVSGVGGSVLMLSMFIYTVYYVVTGDNWISAWLISEFSFAVIQTNSLGGSILYGFAFVISLLVVVVIWFMEGNRHNGADVPVAGGAVVAAAGAEAAVEAPAVAVEAPGIDVPLEPERHPDTPLDLVAAAEQTEGHNEPMDIAAGAM